MFEEPAVYDANRDAKVPLRRTPVVLGIRLVLLCADMLFSRHPSDLWIWLRSMLARGAPLSRPLPWITFAAARAISARVTPASRVFEFGGGNSTLYWAARARQICTVEDNREWFDLLHQAIASRQIKNVELFYESQERPYVDVIRRWPHEYFDVVVVDGAYRRSCVEAAVAHVKPGGMLVLDNTDWHWLRERPVTGVPDDWSVTAYPGWAPMIGYKSETTIYRRPA